MAYSDLSRPDKTCFIIMPMTTSDLYASKIGDPEHFAHVLVHLFRPALEEAGLTAITPSAMGAELIHAEIIRNLEQADYLLCDLSGLNPNVLFELGIRTSLDRPTILVKDNLTEKVPFDLNAINTFTYDSSLTPWSLANEKPRLVEHIQAAVSSGHSGNSMWRYFGLTKRGTPSDAGENPLESKLDLLIHEFSKSQLNMHEVSQPSTILTRQTLREFEISLEEILNDYDIHTYKLIPQGANGRQLILILPSGLSENSSRPEILDAIGNAAQIWGIELTITNF